MRSRTLWWWLPPGAKAVTILFILLLCPTSCASTSLEVSSRVADCLKFRSAPSPKESTEVACLPAGSQVTQIGMVPYWYQVRLQDGREAWGAKKFLEPRNNGGASPTPQVDIHFVDVGTGDGILIDSGDFEIVIDGGMYASIFDRYSRPLIKAPIELAIITHADSDHWKGMLKLLGLGSGGASAGIKVTELWEPGYDRSCKTLPSYGSLIQGLTNLQGLSLRRPLEETHTPAAKVPTNSSLPPPITFPGIPGLKIQLLWSEQDPSGRECSYKINNASIVFRLDIGSKRVLFTGDANGKGRQDPGDHAAEDVEKALLDLERRKPGILKADILKVSHHGSETASTQAFLEKVNPQYSIISASETHHLPKPGVLARLEEVTSVAILRTDVTRKSDNDHIICSITASSIDCNYRDLFDPDTE